MGSVIRRATLDSVPLHLNPALLLNFSSSYLISDDFNCAFWVNRHGRPAHAFGGAPRHAVRGVERTRTAAGTVYLTAIFLLVVLLSAGERSFHLLSVLICQPRLMNALSRQPRKTLKKIDH